MSIKFYNQILNNVYDGIYFVDKYRNIIFWNKGAEEITGYKEEEVIGKKCYDNILSHTDEFGNKMCSGGCMISDVIENKDKLSGNIFLEHKDGYTIPVTTKVLPIYDNEGNIDGAVEIFSDRSTEFQLAHNLEHMTNMAMICPLTNLSNRRHLTNVLHSKKLELERFDVNYGVIFIDIDHFKKINDTYGHDVGDEVLKIIAKLLKLNVRSDDTVGRWGGEEFMCIVSVDDLDTLNKVSEKLRKTVENHSFNIDGNTFNATISLGATLAKSKDLILDVVNRADDLMYISKENGRNIVTIG